MEEKNDKDLERKPNKASSFANFSNLRPVEDENIEKEILKTKKENPESDIIVTTIHSKGERKNRLLYNPDQNIGRNILVTKVFEEDVLDEENPNMESESIEEKNNVYKFIEEQEIETVNDASGEVLGIDKNWKKLILIFGGSFLFILCLLIMLIYSWYGYDSNINKQPSQNFQDYCGQMSINTTSMNKWTFVEKTRNYMSSINNSHAQVFADNAEVIYDLAIQNNINPELIVVRAVLEGFSPGKSKNNYWGMGCTNTGGYEKCINYASFDEGVLGFIKNVSQYDSLASMMAKYSYIGSYWYNPGASSYGGCYYLEYIKPYLSTQRYNVVRDFCKESSPKCSLAGESGCSPTTEEDQKAYTDYQVASMTNLRDLKYELEPMVCDQYGSSCTLFQQDDPKWSGINLGQSTSTMGSSGCAVTAIAIALTCSNLTMNVENFDPSILINTLNNDKCFTNGGSIYWACSVNSIQKISPEVKSVSTHNVVGLSNEEKLAVINTHNDTNNFILLYFQNEKHKRGHYVVYSGVSNEQFLTKDPLETGISNVAIKDVRQVVFYLY
ncbi:MAG: hypothetical protein E7172_00645 [Firmicutes bacterium]|nr:hypothetical protein [Bacillota bacterium]